MAPIGNIPECNLESNEFSINYFYKKYLRGLSPRAKYVDRSTAAFRRS
jgi:hypothetical protein